MRARDIAGRRFAALVTTAIGLCSLLQPALAHPHNLISVETTVEISSGQIRALRHKWTFDKYYSFTAIRGLDKNHDGTYSRAELSNLAKVYIEGLKTSAYFTVVRLGSKQIELAAPVDSWLTRKDGLLSLHFSLPLKTPLSVTDPGFNFAIYDPGYFTAFAFARDNPIRLSKDAPKACRATIGDASADSKTAHNGTFPGSPGANIGGTLAHIVSLSCKPAK